MSTARRTTSTRRRIGLHLAHVLVLSSMVSVLAAVSGAAPASATVPGDNGKIVFTSNRDGNDEIYVMNADGSDQTRLTQNAAPDTSAAFSPDGRRIAFISGRGAGYEIFVMNADGSGQTKLTTNAAPNFAPAFSPDGSKIAFSSYRNGRNQIYVVNADGSGETRLTNDASDNMSPAFSPDGSTITFRRTAGTLQDIFAMDADGTDPVNLTRSGDGEAPDSSFSPDGNTIAFSSNRGTAGDLEVFVMDADGSNQTNLTHTVAPESDPVFSPDGTKIAYTRLQSGNRDIYVMNADGTGQTNLTDDAANDTEPDWGPAVTDDDVPETILISGPNGPTNQATATFTFRSNGAGSTFECRVDDAEYAACTSPHTTASLGEGDHTFAVRAIDAGGDADPSPALRTFTVDTVAPNTFFSGGPFGPTNDSTPTFTFSSNEPGVTFECHLNGESFTPCSSPYTVELTVDRDYTIEVRATDAAGNVDASPAIRPFKLDRSAPDTFIWLDPGTVTRDNTPTFGLITTKSGSRFECQVDDAAFSACSSTYTTPQLEDGSHTFGARSIDTLGNVDPSPAVHTFTVDTVAPVTTITGGPEGATNDNTPTFTFEASEPGVTFECGFNGAFSDCTSPYTSSGIGDGEHTFEVRATDAAGNVEVSAASRTFTLDRNPPTTSITSGPSGWTGDSTPTFGFTSPEPGATFECRVDDAAFEACTNPHTTAELPDGEHVFEARAVDTTGNVDPIPAARAFTVDTIAPDTVISSGPSGIVYDRTPSFAFEFTDGALSHECRVDDEPFAPCESPVTTDPLSDGEHTFEVRGIDGGGNVDPTPAKSTFTVDTEIFRTGITAGPSGLTSDSTPTFGFATPDPNSTFECRVAPAAFAECTSPYTASELSDGEHTFEVRATDSYGNLEPSPASRTFTVDSTAPDTTLDSGPTGTIDDQTPTFEFSSPDAGATFECRVDGADFGPCASPYTTALLPDGSHTFQARATDAAGNTDATPASRTFTVQTDTTPPKTRIDSGPADLTNKTSATFTFSADEPATFECKLDAGAYTPCESGDSFGPLGSGTHLFAVRATDAARNVDPVPATKSWIVDVTPPQTTITGAPGALSLSSVAKLAFASSEGGSSFQCQLDGGAWEDCASPKTYKHVHLGNHTFAVRATDPAGNTDPTPATVKWCTLGLLPL